MLDQKNIELSKIRLQKSKKCYLSAIQDIREEDYDSANNRAYYSMYHAIRSLLALEGLDFKKHSQTIGYFNKNYVHAKLIGAQFNKMIIEASNSRNSSDYDDYYVATLEEAETNTDNANKFIEAVKQYILARFKAENIQGDFDADHANAINPSDYGYCNETDDEEDLEV